MPAEHITSQGVLVLEASQPMIELLGSMLRHLGRRDIRSATTLPAAMAELNRRVFEVVLIEDRFAGTDAIQLVRRLRGCADCPNRFTPFVMMASAPDAARIAAARDAGVTEFLRKPFAAADLQARLRVIREAPRANVETPAYTGPDRRRRPKTDFGTERRGGG